MTDLVAKISITIELSQIVGFDHGIWFVCLSLFDQYVPISTFQSYGYWWVVIPWHMHWIAHKAYQNSPYLLSTLVIFYFESTLGEGVNATAFRPDVPDMSGINFTTYCFTKISSNDLSFKQSLAKLQRGHTPG